MSAQPTVPNTPPDSVNIEINGVPMLAPKGSMIIHAADKAGLAIPRFCYHEKLPIAANCRMCLVDVEKMPKPAPACATPVMEGMKVYTQTKRALDAQRNVMEFLLINHPLDCPICDQGGECELQDVSMGYGRSVSRYVDRKRVVSDEDMGPLVATDMTRCIQCTRCVRFTSDIAGTYELGGMNRGERLEIGTYDGKPLMTELSGNVIDVCPVGALTNRVYRYKARAWELTARDSVGYHDALGSNMFLHVHRNEVVRGVPRDNESVNECWLSDRDRYSHEGLYAADRATQPMVRDGDQWRVATWDEALSATVDILKAAQANDVGVLVHPATSNEEGASLAALGFANIDHRLMQLDFADDAVAEAFAMPVAEIEHAKVVLLVGSNIRHEIPLLHQRLHKASKRGQKVFAINPIDFEFTFSLAAKQIVKPSLLAKTVSNVAIEKSVLFEALKAAEGNAVIMLGELAENHAQASQIHAAVRELASATGAKINRIPQGANAVGLKQLGVLPAAGAKNAAEMLHSKLSTFVIYGVEPQYDFANNTQALKALANAKVIAFTAYASEQLKSLAHVILPIGLLPELEASLINLDGMTQFTSAAGKLPGEARAGWRVLRGLAEKMNLKGFDFTDLNGLRAQMKPIARQSGTGVAAQVNPSASGELERIVSTPIYRGDAVLRRAKALNEHMLTHGAFAVLHPEEALAHGVSDGVMVKIGDGVGTLALPVKISTGVPQGAVWIESGYEVTAPLSATAGLSLVRA